MKNRSLNILFLLFWLVPALACNVGGAGIATPTAVSGPTATAPAVATSATTGKFSPITFSAGVPNYNKAVDPLNTFPVGMTQVYAVFDYTAMQDGEAWHIEWKHDGQVQPNLSQDEPWKGGKRGSWWVSMYDRTGIKTGEWVLNLYLGGALQQTAKATIEPNPAGQPDFGPITMALGKDAQDQPINPFYVGGSYPPLNTSLVYAFFDGIDVPKGTDWTSQWFMNGEATIDPKQHTWDLGPNENAWISFGTPDNSPLVSGTYELKLVIGSRLVDIATFRLL